MFFLFGKKKDTPAASGQETKKRSLDAIESETTVLQRKEMVKVEGGKSNSKSLANMHDFGGTIPL